MTGSSSEFDWFDIKPMEWRLCAIVLLGGIALHFPAVYYPAGFYIEAFLSMVSFFTPISGILWLSAAQVVPDPPIGPFTSSQMAILGAAILFFIRHDRLSLDYCKPVVLAMCPLFVWQTAMNYLHGSGHQLPLLMIYAGMTGCVAAMMAGESGNRLGACLAAFLAGQALCACVFWIIKLGLGAPVQAFDTSVYGDSSEIIRIGTARGNAGMLGMSAALATGFVGIFMFYAPQRKVGISQRLLLGLAFLGMCLTVPALISSGSRGGMIAAVAGLLILALFGRSISLFSVGLGVAGVALLLAFGWERLGLQQHWDEMRERQTSQTEESAHGALVAGRELEWGPAWDAIMDSPVLGGGQVVKKSYFGSEEKWLSHSTYLDVGLVGGLPGMLLFLWFCMKPMEYLWRYRRVGVLLWLLSVYVTVIVCNASGSGLQVKTFWILWGLASVLPATTDGPITGARYKRNTTADPTARLSSPSRSET
jgi:hypothetical protein